MRLLLLLLLSSKNRIETEIGMEGGGGASAFLWSKARVSRNPTLASAGSTCQPASPAGMQLEVESGVCPEIDASA